MSSNKCLSWGTFYCCCLRTGNKGMLDSYCLLLQTAIAIKTVTYIILITIDTYLYSLTPMILYLSLKHLGEIASNQQHTHYADVVLELRRKMVDANFIAVIVSVRCYIVKNNRKYSVSYRK